MRRERLGILGVVEDQEPPVAPAQLGVEQLNDCGRIGGGKAETLGKCNEGAG